MITVEEMMIVTLRYKTATKDVASKLAKQIPNIISKALKGLDEDRFFDVIGPKSISVWSDEAGKLDENTKDIEVVVPLGFLFTIMSAEDTFERRKEQIRKNIRKIIGNSSSFQLAFS
ncbi:MAG: hypothetical protein V1711_00445 [bacterium]